MMDRDVHSARAGLGGRPLPMKIFLIKSTNHSAAFRSGGVCNRRSLYYSPLFINFKRIINIPHNFTFKKYYNLNLRLLSISRERNYIEACLMGSAQASKQSLGQSK